MFNMRPSIPVSQDATKRLKMYHEIHALVCTVLHMHKDEMQARSKPSTVPHFVRGDKVSVVTRNLCMRGQPNRNCVIDICDLGADLETYLRITTINENSLTLGVSRQQSKTPL
jgi:hypothetical protein